MPNGLPWTKEGFTALEAFFARLEPALSEFATARNVAIERYYHDAPTWSFLFRHPRGGVAKIDLERANWMRVVRPIATWVICMTTMVRLGTL